MITFVVQTTPEGGSQGSFNVVAEHFAPFGDKGIAFHAQGRIVACFASFVACAPVDSFSNGTVTPGSD